MLGDLMRFCAFLLICLMALVGAIVGGLLGNSYSFLSAGRTLEYAMPHHVPKYQGGISLRFAMVHDVIHERFPRHGKAYYEERNRLARLALEEESRRSPRGTPSPQHLALLDDLGVGMEMLGRHQEAIDLMRGKLKQQQELGLTGQDLYSSYANLGTFLILWQLQEGFADVATAKERLTEGLELIHRSIAVNPQAHFGREIWQAVILEFLLAVIDKPDLLLQFDMVGNRLDKPIDPAKEHCLTDIVTWNRRLGWVAKRTPDEQLDAAERSRFRGHITMVGAENNWSSVRTSHQEPVPFDEPVLGIIGMWRMGGGANPHFALALGEIMMRVGQRYIAWSAYERAVQLAYVLTDRRIADGFIHHCRKRQELIEQQLPAEEKSGLRSRFQSELAHGRRYQEAYQAYEAQRIQEGASIDDPSFFDAFEARQGPIATSVGLGDHYVVEHREFIQWPTVILFAGVFAFLTGLGLRLSIRLLH